MADLWNLQLEVFKGERRTTLNVNENLFGLSINNINSLWEEVGSFRNQEYWRRSSITLNYPLKTNISWDRRTRFFFLINQRKKVVEGHCLNILEENNGGLKTHYLNQNVFLMFPKSNHSPECLLSIVSGCAVERKSILPCQSLDETSHQCVLQAYLYSPWSIPGCVAKLEAKGPTFWEGQCWLLFLLKELKYATN